VTVATAGSIRSDTRPETIAFRDPAVATRIALRSLARRILELTDEMSSSRADHPIGRGARTAHAQARRVRHPDLRPAAHHRRRPPRPPQQRTGLSDALRLRAAPASSGNPQRHRLNRGGDRAANSALHMAATCRLRLDPRTKAYAT
jgi:transposase